MDPIALRYKRRAERYPDENEEERWNGVALDCYLRTGHVPDEVLHYKALASAGLLSLKYREDQPRVPAGNPDGGEWTRDNSLSGSQRKLERSKRIRIAVDVIDVCIGEGFSEHRDASGNSTGFTIYYECRDGFTFSRMSNRRIGVVPDPRKWRKL
jgi:hypothetical protein